MATDKIELLDLLIINNNLVTDEKDLPQLIGGRAVVAQDIKHRILDSGYVYRLIGERGQNVIKRILNRVELIVEDDLRVKAGTVKAEFQRVNSSAELSISCESDVGDVLIALPIVPEDYQTDSGENIEPEVLFYLPRVLGESSSESGGVLDVEVISLGDAERLVEMSVVLGDAELIINDQDIKILEVGS